MSSKLRSNAFYMTLTPTVQSTTRSQYGKMMSDFSTQLRTPVRLNPAKKWRATLANIFIPLDTKFLNHGIYKHHWFQYIWCEAKQDGIFEEKHYFLNTNEWDDVTEFVKEFNRNRIIGHDISLCKVEIPIELGITANEFIYIRFNQDIAKGSTVGFRLHGRVGYKLLGINTAQFKGSIFNSFLNETPVDNIPYTITVNDDDDTMDILFTPTDDKIMKNTTTTSKFKYVRHREEDGSRMIDIECSIIESNKIAGISGRTLRCVVDNLLDGITEVSESRQDMYLPIELHEFSYIRCRLLHHGTLVPLEYKYESVVGRPYIVLKIAPQ